MRIKLSDDFAMLVQQRASGALEISGNPGATVFLSGGNLVFAESPAVPDLRTRLICSKRLPPGQWDQVAESGPAQGGTGALLVSRGVVTSGELWDLLRSVTLDALIALAMPAPPGPAAPGTGFWPWRSPEAGSLLRLDLASAWADATRKADLLARREIMADAHPRLCALRRPWAVVTSEQWALAWVIDGLHTVRALAWQNGLALCDTMEWVGDLVRAGACTMNPAGYPAALLSPAVTDMADAEPGAPPATAGAVPAVAPRREEPGSRESSPRPQVPPSAGSPQSPEPADGPALPPGGPDAATLPLLLLPRREPGESLPATPATAGTPAMTPWRAEDVSTPRGMSHADLLRRVLHGLRRTDLNARPAAWQQWPRRRRICRASAFKAPDAGPRQPGPPAKENPDPQVGTRTVARSRTLRRIPGPRSGRQGHQFPVP